MRWQKQLNKHEPENGVWGDCHRTAIACVLDMDAKDVPHFMDGDRDPEVCHIECEAWLRARGISVINVLMDGSASVREILRTVAVSNYRNKGLCYILGGKSRSGCGHSVVCMDDEIVCDPSLNDSGIIGPMDDGYYWLTFFGTMQAVHLPARTAVSADVA